MRDQNEIDSTYRTFCVTFEISIKLGHIDSMHLFSEFTSRKFEHTFPGKKSK